MQDNYPDKTDFPEADFLQRCKEDTKTVIRFGDEMGPIDSKEGLKQLFRKIIDDLSINERRWRRYMVEYLKDPLNGIPNNTEEHVQQRSALNKNLLTGVFMTWKVFCRGLRFLRVKRFRFSVTLVHNNNTTTEHGMWFNVRNNYPSIEEDDDPRTTFSRIPVVEVRDNHTPTAEHSDNVGAQPRISVPPPIDFAQWRKSSYPSLPEEEPGKPGA